MRLPADPAKKLLSLHGRTALIAPLLLPLVGGAVVAMAAVCLIAQQLWGDQGWLLYVASRVLDGARIGTDIVEVNGPTIIWLSEIPVALGRLFDVSPDAAMRICLGALLVLSPTWCALMVRRIPRAGSGA